MNTYIAKLIFHIHRGENSSPAQYDEQLRMIEAPDELTALEKAQKLGQAEQEVFMDEQNHRITWTFLAISDLIQTEAQKDGMLVYSFTETPGDGAAYLDFINSRQAYINERFHAYALN